MIQAKIAAALAVALAFAAMGAWALWERGQRLQCKVELVAAVDQAKILAAALERQGKAIDKLGDATKATITRTGRILDLLELQHAQTIATIGSLEDQLAKPTPEGKDCRDALKEWRAEPGK